MVQAAAMPVFAALNDVGSNPTRDNSLYDLQIIDVESGCPLFLFHVYFVRFLAT